MRCGVMAGGGVGRLAWCSYNPPVLHGARRTSGLVPAPGASKTQVRKFLPCKACAPFI